MLLLLLISLVSSYDDPVETALYSPGDEGSKAYRIPAIARTQKGTLLAVCDKRWNGGGDLPGKIDVVLRRSTDNGKSWGETIVLASGNSRGYGDASLVVDKDSGAVMCIFNGNNGFWSSTAKDPIRQYYSLSYDDGLTWTAPVDITHFLYGDECSNPERKEWPGMFISSGCALQLRSGRIMAVGVVRKNGHSGLLNYVCYTDDLGKTWDVGISPGCDKGDESKVVELNNGDVMMSIRHAPHRYQALSHDKGLTFDDYTERTDMNDPNCNGEIIRYTSTKDGYDKDRLLFSNDDSTSGRKNLTIKVSYDEGASWKYSKVLYPNGCAYSTMTILNDGSIAVYYEKDGGGSEIMTVAILSLEWLTDGNDKYTPPN